MAFDKLTEYSATNASNTSVGDVDVTEGMLPSNVNNAIRELMTHQKEAFGSGTPLYVDQTNNRVGIGTSSPDALLQIEKSDSGTTIDKEPSSQSGPNIAIHNSNQTANNLSSVQFTNRGTNGVAETATAGIHVKHEAQGGTYSYGSMNFNTTNSAGAYATRMTIDSSGNLLVGKTADNVATVGIEARGTGPLISTRDGADALRLNRLNSDGEIIQLRKDGTVVGSIGVNGSLLHIALREDGSNPVALAGSGSDTGAVVPATTSGAERDNAINLGKSTNRFKHGYFANTVYTASVAGITDNDTYINFANNNIMQFITGGSERARFDSGSRFLVGQTSAAGIGAATDANSLELGPGYIVINRDDTATATQLAFGKNGSVVGSVSTTGSGTTYNTTSDIRLKQDIEPLAATDKLMAMNPVSYNWKADPDGPRSMGFIAQEMQEVMPEAVSTGDDDDAMMSMDYGRITPILVSALQDAHRKIDELAAEIAELKAN